MPEAHITTNSCMAPSFRNIRTVTAALLALFALAILADLLYQGNLEWRLRTRRADARLSSLESEADRLLRQAEEEISAAGDPAVLFHSTLGSNALRKGITLLVYQEGRIAYWSDNSIAFPVIYRERFQEHKPVFYSNGWFIPIHREFPDHEMLALIKVYRQYPIVNNILRSGFPETFPLPSGTGITFDQADSEFRLMGSEDEFHFGLIFPDKKPNTIFLTIPVLLWLAFFLVLLRLAVLFAHRLDRGSPGRMTMPLLCGCLALIYIVILVAGVPPTVRSTELFSPFHWSAGSMVPSVGHLILLGMLALTVIKFSFTSGRFNSPLKSKGVWRRIIPGAVLVTGFLLFLLAEGIFRDLLINSDISFEAFRILNMSFMSLAGFITVMLLLTAPVMIFMRVARMMRGWSLREAAAVIGAALLTVLPVCLLIPGCRLWVFGWVLLTLAAIMLWQARTRSDSSLTIILSLLTALFSTLLIISSSAVREERHMKVLAISLASDNDMVAEGMLMDMWPALSEDTLLAQLVRKMEITGEVTGAVYNYLEEGYFYGYWENYDINIVVCRNDSPLSLGEGGGKAENCFSWFDNRIRNEGDTITNTGCYFIHNNTGRAWYLARLLYDVAPGITNGLFIELVSHIETYLAGYPELLLDESHQRFPKLKDISYAKYNKGVLVLRSGDYPYDSRIAEAGDDAPEYTIEKTRESRHLYYNIGDMTLVITTARVRAMDMLITFAYLFIITLAYMVVLLAVFTQRPAEFLKTDTFRRRLQLSFAAVLTVVFIIVITAALKLSTRQMRNNHIRIIHEKATSLSIELEHVLFEEGSIEKGWQTDDYPSLNHLLVDFSNVFFTDINLYSPSGNLIATSRPEVFIRKIEGSMIDPVAYGVLTSAGREEYIGTEMIGNLSYLSAYLPFYNADNELLAYLNIPYFAMQNLLARETTNLVVTLVNFALLFLLIMMWVSVILSERITSPLYILQQAMASVEYGKKNEHISYSSRDEVGELVRQYNRMTDELEESARKLARSEREMAWREMARQIAHEIKNPLTPMKLNVQQLFKSWNDGVSDFDTRIRSFTDNQIEYIDNLSSIASAFSSFARLPAAEPAEIDVIAQLATSVAMFGNAEEMSITVETGGYSKVMVLVDKEHLNSIFSNLLKNAIQSVPPGRKGEIRIEVSPGGDLVQIRFADNGTGIPPELIPRMFTPNFTTKSSGMGLGLSIAKRYVEGAGGRIWFETEQGEGSVFTVEFPLLAAVKT